MNVIIVGAGVAGFTAAEAVRKNNPSAKVTILSLEGANPYYRPRLPEVVSGKAAPDAITAHPESWFQGLGLDFRKGEGAVEVDPAKKEVLASSGARLGYDRLLLATGALPFVPPIKGSRDGALGGIHPLRTLDDALALKAAADGAKAALLLGSGLLGLEIAAALAQRGLTVHVLERAERILPLQTTPGSAALLQSLLSQQGLAFHLGTELSGVRGGARVEAAELSDGKELGIGLVAVATGVRPVTSLARAIGLKVDRAVVVDQFLETSTEDVYAAGDCAQTPDGKGGLWSIGRLEGLAAGFNLAQEDRAKRAPYKPVPPSSLLKIAGLDLISAGNIDPDGKLASAVYETPKTYRKVVVDGQGAVCGYTNLGTTEGNRELAQALSKRAVPSPATLEAFGKDGFDFKSLLA